MNPIQFVLFIKHSVARSIHALWLETMGTIYQSRLICLYECLKLIEFLGHFRNGLKNQMNEKHFALKVDRTDCDGKTKTANWCRNNELMNAPLLWVTYTHICLFVTFRVTQLNQNLEENQLKDSKVNWMEGKDWTTKLRHNIDSIEHTQTHTHKCTITEAARVQSWNSRHFKH